MTTAMRSTTPEELQAELKQIEEAIRTFTRVTTQRSALVAQTPKETIWTLNKARLYRYIPTVPDEQRHRVPLLLVFAIMNRPDILDLRPGHSFVEYMVQHGYDVYLLDWGVPGPEDRGLTFSDYALEYLPRAIRKVKSVSGSDEFSILGWCLGALIVTIYAALRPEEGLRNLILLTAPLDFSDKTAGGFARWVNDPAFDAEKIVNTFGIVPGELINYGAKVLKPVENYIGSYLNLWDNIDNPKVVEAWHAMNTWVNDVIPMAGAAYRELIQQFYRENRLVNGTYVARGETVDLAKVRANLLSIIADRDHITPPGQSEGAFQRFSSQDKTIHHIPGGHIGIMAGSGASKRVWPMIDEWLAARSD
jgi:poly[(R)-3-hydroxyalkanoate] polymerase subunit PhaC